MLMDIDNRAVEALTSFGLTEYEAKVYLTLAARGTMKASALADASNIPRPHVYSVIKLLHEKGLIIIIPEKVNKYKAQPLDSVVKKLIEDRVESIKSLEEIGKDLTNRFQNKGHADDDTGKDKVRLYHGRWSIIQLIRDMLNRAESTCEFMTNWTGFFNTTGMIDYELISLKKRNVHTRFLLPVEKDNLKNIEKLSNAGIIRHLDSFDHMEIPYMDGSPEETFLSVVVIDGSEALFVSSQSEGGEESAIWTGQREFVHMIRLMFDNMWRNAPDLKAKIIEIETGRKQERLNPIYGDVEVETMSRNIISRSRSSVCCVLSQEQIVHSLNTFVADIKRLKGRGITIKFLVPLRDDVSGSGRARLLTRYKGDMLNAINVLETLGVKIRHPRQDMILRMVLSDDEVIFNLIGETLPVSGWGSMGVYTNHSETINRIQNYFNNVWENSMDARARIQEVDQFISHEVLKDGEEGLKKYFKRLSELNMGNFSIKSSDPAAKTIIVECTDTRDTRLMMKARASGQGDICASGMDALRSFAQYIYENTKMDCIETRCVSRGDAHCEFMLRPSQPRKSIGSELVSFFESIKSQRAKDGQSYMASYLNK